MVPSDPRDRGQKNDPYRDLWEEVGDEEFDAGTQLAPRRKGWLQRWKQRRTQRREAAVSEPVPEQPQTLVRSPLFLGLVGGLIVLCIAALVFSFLIRGNRAQFLFGAAESAMQERSYAQALSDFDRFLESYPNHEKAPLARVLRGFCAVYRYTEGSSPSWENGLRETEALVSQVGGIAQFQSHLEEFGRVTGRIAGGLAETARSQVDPEAARGSRKALRLLEDQVPEEMRPAGVIEKTEQVLAEAELSLERKTALADTLAAMNEDLAGGDFLSVYRRRRDLARRWPNLAANPELSDPLEQAQQQERDAVQFAELDQPAEREARGGTRGDAIVLARWAQRPEAAGSVDEPDRPVVYAQVADALHALDAETGQVLWRQFVGYEHPFLPISVTADGRAATLLADTKHHELVAVDRTTQDLIWRQAFDEPIVCAPAVVRNRLYQPLGSGRLLVLDLMTGRLEGEFRFPQPIYVTPLADPTGRFLTVSAESETLYLLSLNDRRCVASFYLGHGEGSLTAPMVHAGPYQIVCENDRADSCLLHALSARGPEAVLSEVQSHRIQGWVHAPAVLHENRLFVTTDQGRLYAFSLAARDVEEPLILDAQTGDATEGGGQPFVVPRNDREVWLIGGEFDQWILNEPQQRFEGVRRGGAAGNTVAGALGALQFSWWQPVQTREDVVFFATRSAAASGVLVTAVSLREEHVHWQAVLGAGLVDLSVAEDPSELVALTRTGDLFRIHPAEGSGTRVLQQPVSSFRIREGLEGPVAKSDLDATKRLYWSPRSARSLLLRSKAAEEPSMALSQRRLPAELSAAPVPYQQGILAPGSGGLLSWLELPSMKPLAEAFQAPFEVAQPPQWHSVAVTSDGSILAADLNGLVYRVEVVDQPLRHLQGEAVQSVVGPLRSGLTSAGGAVYLVDGKQTLWAFSADGREQLGKWSFPDGLAGDLLVAEDEVLVREPSGVLHRFDGSGRATWKVPLEAGALVGSPGVVDNRVVLASQDGMIHAINRADGSRAWSVETGQSLESGPWLLGNRFVVEAADGTLLLYPVPGR